MIGHFVVSQAGEVYSYSYVGTSIIQQQQFKRESRVSSLSMVVPWLVELLFFVASCILYEVH